MNNNSALRTIASAFAIVGLLLFAEGFSGQAAAQEVGSDVRVGMVGPAVPIGPGEAVVYNVAVRNDGPTTATNVVLNTGTPSNMTFIATSAPGGWVCNGPAPGTSGPISCSTALMPVGTVAQFRFSFRVTPGTPAGLRITNTVTVSSFTIDPSIANNTASVKVTIGAIGDDTPGIFDAATATWFLRNSHGSGAADLAFAYGAPAQPFMAVAGDWNGNGVDTPGLFDPVNNVFFLRNQNAPGAADLTFQFGPTNSGWIPVAGDWNGDGVDTIGLFDPVNSTFFLKNSNSAGAADLTFQFGPAGAGWVPVAGDWTNTGTTRVGLYDPATGAFFLKFQNTPGAADLTFAFGATNLVPLSGDWDSNGIETIGVYDPVTGAWFLRNTNNSGVAHVTYIYGSGGEAPVTGNWDGL